MGLRLLHKKDPALHLVTVSCKAVSCPNRRHGATVASLCNEWRVSSQYPGSQLACLVDCVGGTHHVPGFACLIGLWSDSHVTKGERLSGRLKGVVCVQRSTGDAAARAETPRAGELAGGTPRLSDSGAAERARWRI